MKRKQLGHLQMESKWKDKQYFKWAEPRSIGN